MAAYRPARYEIYETAGAWIQCLRAHHDVVLQPTDGRSLAATPDDSADLVQAHKVFDGIPFLPPLCYWTEMARTTKPGGHVVFDVITEDCLDPPTAESWRASGIDNGAYSAVVPRSLVLSTFERLGFEPPRHTRDPHRARGWPTCSCSGMGDAVGVSANDSTWTGSGLSD